jgi:hypothetical protein
MNSTNLITWGDSKGKERNRENVAKEVKIRGREKYRGKKNEPMPIQQQHGENKTSTVRNRKNNGRYLTLTALTWWTG